MKYLLMTAGLLAGMAVQAQDLKTLFVELPDSLSPLLTKVNREDFGDFLESGMRATVKDRFGGQAEMMRLTADYLFLKETTASTVEMKLLPVNDSVKVVCCVQTYLASVADSRVTFYSTRWEPLPQESFLTPPVADDFFAPARDGADSADCRECRRLADMTLLQASLSATSDSLTFVYSTPDYLDKEAAQRLRACLRPAPVAYRWQQGRFQPLVQSGSMLYSTKTTE